MEEKICWHFCPVIWEPEAKPHAQNFEIQGPRVGWMDFGGWSLARLLHAGLKSGLMCSKDLGLPLLQVSTNNVELEVLFNKFRYRTNLMALLFS
jgi:hypothetical protein